MNAVSVFLYLFFQLSTGMDAPSPYGFIIYNLEYDIVSDASLSVNGLKAEFSPDVKLWLWNGPPSSTYTYEISATGYQTFVYRDVPDRIGELWLVRESESYFWEGMIKRPCQKAGEAFLWGGEEEELPSQQLINQQLEEQQLPFSYRFPLYAHQEGDPPRLVGHVLNKQGKAELLPNWPDSDRIHLKGPAIILAEDPPEVRTYFPYLRVWRDDNFDETRLKNIDAQWLPADRNSHYLQIPLGSLHAMNETIEQVRACPGIRQVAVETRSFH
ncbi:MAG: hypothetical protein AAFV95_12120 [Bacteroidota bacterium]